MNFAFGSTEMPKALRHRVERQFKEAATRRI